MTLGTSRRIATTAIAASLLCLTAAAAFAQAPTPPTPNKGDTAWMMTASVLVLLMTIPGLALFYGGLARTKNMLSMLMQVFYTVCVVCIIWVLYGYGMAFSEGGAYNATVGGFSKAILAGITPDTNAETFSDGVVIPEYVYICFQMTFAAITPALIVGSMAERMKFSAIVLFIPLWVTLVYFPIAHMVWYWSGPSAIVTAAKAVAEASGDAKAAAEAALATAQANAGLAFQWGALDFAGGTVVHINSGIAGLMGALLVGKRVGFGKEAMPPLMT
jgi:Amt family ammonium transporter